MLLPISSEDGSAINYYAIDVTVQSNLATIASVTSDLTKTSDTTYTGAKSTLDTLAKVKAAITLATNATMKVTPSASAPALTQVGFDGATEATDGQVAAGGAFVVTVRSEDGSTFAQYTVTLS